MRASCRPGQPAWNLALRVTLGLVILPVLSASSQAKPPIGRVEGEVTLSLEKRTLSARLTYDYLATEQPEHLIRLYLNRALDLTALTCGICRSFTFEREAIPFPTVVITLSKSLQVGEHAVLTMAYSGRLDEAFNAEHAYLELGLDNFWFPIHPKTESYSFRYRLSVKTDQPAYQLVSNGRVSRRGEGWLVESAVPDMDIDLAMSPGFRSVAYLENGYDLRVVSTDLAVEASTSLLSDIRESLTFLNGRFGAQDPVRQVTAVIRPFEIQGQGGYARKGYFVLPKVQNPKGSLFYITHELAHRWWLAGDQQNAWLNESFAEYSAMLAIRKLRGVETFNTMLAEKKKRSEALPPIYGFDRTTNRQQSPDVLYNKGPVLLSELEAQLGEQRFATFLQRTAVAQPRNTDALLELLAQVSSRQIADAFFERLKQ